MRAVNHGMGEEWKKKKDEEKVKQWVKERVRLNRGRRQQGLEEEEEEEGDDGPKPPVQWDELEGRPRSRRGRTCPQSRQNRAAHSVWAFQAEERSEMATHQ